MTAVAFSDILGFVLDFDGCGLGLEGLWKVCLRSCGLVNITAQEHSDACCGQAIVSLCTQSDGASMSRYTQST